MMKIKYIEYSSECIIIHINLKCYNKVVTEVANKI